MLLWQCRLSAVILWASLWYEAAANWAANDTSALVQMQVRVALEDSALYQTKGKSAVDLVKDMDETPAPTPVPMMNVQVVKIKGAFQTVLMGFDGFADAADLSLKMNDFAAGTNKPFVVATQKGIAEALGTARDNIKITGFDVEPFFARILHRGVTDGASWDDDLMQAREVSKIKAQMRKSHKAAPRSLLSSRKLSTDVAVTSRRNDPDPVGYFRLGWHGKHSYWTTWFNTYMAHWWKFHIEQDNVRIQGGGEIRKLHMFFRSNPQKWPLNLVIWKKEGSTFTIRKTWKCKSRIPTESPKPECV
jgi:hypothetical protein